MERPSIRILLVDDSEVVQAGLKLYFGICEDLKLIGQALDGREAICACARTSPDLVLMDINMPRMDGIEAAQIIHQTQPEILIIGLSSFDDLQRTQMFLDAGAVAVISKQQPLDEIAKTIRGIFIKNIHYEHTEKIKLVI